MTILYLKNYNWSLSESQQEEMTFLAIDGTRSGGSIDLSYDLDPFNQGEVDFNITSVVNCSSEE